jgi:phosphatidylinositol glycan class V
VWKFVAICVPACLLFVSAAQAQPVAMAPPVAGVVRLAAASRVLVLSLSLLARLLFRPYDTSATLNPPCLSSSSPSASSSPSPNLSAAVSSLAVWDGVHFARPAECGYEYEQSFAFLPLLPASIALLARSRKPLTALP